MRDQDIAEKLGVSLEEDGRVTCAAMHKIARELGIQPVEVGDVATAADIQASQCQIGLFGHGPREDGKGRIVESGVEVSDELGTAIRGSLVNGRLPCAAAWQIASEFKRSRLDVGNVAETLDVRISP
ncbi:MAG: hypothetical protein CEE40_12840, partial [Chloroflexi bacterium B3_Chlor]